MSVWDIILGVLFFVLSIGSGIVIHYFVSGEWLWEREQKKEDRNWSPPR